jgi:hypothetical protein
MSRLRPPSPWQPVGLRGASAGRGKYHLDGSINGRSEAGRYRAKKEGEPQLRDSPSVSW